MAIRRRVFDEVGLFDERISGRGDETEWFHRAGLVFRYDQSLIIWHTREGATISSLVAAGYRQGRAVPLAMAQIDAGTWKPRLSRVWRFVGHAVRRRCVNGLLQASRELGALRGSWAEGWLDVLARPGAVDESDHDVGRDRQSS